MRRGGITIDYDSLLNDEAYAIRQQWKNGTTVQIQTQDLEGKAGQTACGQ
jgi:hypothetical protein